MSPATTTTRQRIRSAKQHAGRRCVEEQVAQTRWADAEPPPINPRRLGPAHATEAYAAARREREEARARQKRAAAVRAAAAERVTVIQHEPAPVEADRPRESTLLGTDGRPLDAAQLVGPDGRPLQSGQPAIELPYDDDAELLFDPLDDETLELDELRRRDGYGRHLELAHIIREFGQEYLAAARRGVARAAAQARARAA